MVAHTNLFMMRFRRKKKKNKEKKAAAAAAAAAAAQTVDSAVSCTDLTASGQGKISVTESVVSVDKLHTRNTWEDPRGIPTLVLEAVLSSSAIALCLFVLVSNGYTVVDTVLRGVVSGHSGLSPELLSLGQYTRLGDIRLF